MNFRGQGVGDHRNLQAHTTSGSLFRCEKWADRAAAHIHIDCIYLWLPTVQKRQEIIFFLGIQHCSRVLDSWKNQPSLSCVPTFSRASEISGKEIQRMGETGGQNDVLPRKQRFLATAISTLEKHAFIYKLQVTYIAPLSIAAIEKLYLMMRQDRLNHENFFIHTAHS